MGQPVIQNLVQLQNVSLKLAQRITCDEEERQRFGYKLVTVLSFPGNRRQARPQGCRGLLWMARASCV